MSLDHHREILTLLCRTCGKRARSAKEKTAPKLCEKYAKKISDTFNINIDDDEQDIHLKHICHPCYCKTYKGKSVNAAVWCAHPRIGDCGTCKLFQIAALSAMRRTSPSPTHCTLSVWNIIFWGQLISPVAQGWVQAATDRSTEGIINTKMETMAPFCTWVLPFCTFFQLKQPLHSKFWSLCHDECYSGHPMCLIMMTSPHNLFINTKKMLFLPLQNWL